MNPLIDFFVQQAMYAGIGAIMTTIKNPDHAAQVKTQLGHLVDTICVAYGWTVTKN